MASRQPPENETFHRSSLIRTSPINRTRNLSLFLIFHSGWSSKLNWPEIFRTLCSLANWWNHWAYNWAWCNTFIQTTSCSSNTNCNFGNIWTHPTINPASWEVQHYHTTYSTHYRNSPSPWHPGPYVNLALNSTHQPVSVHPATPAYAVSSHTSTYLRGVCKIQVLYQWSAISAEDKKNVPRTWCPQTRWLR